MEENLITIERICGSRPLDQELVEIGNDPNFIFENDPSFIAIRLFDADGNIINVNSWIECAHYVNGGWSQDNFEVGGDVLFLSITLFLFAGYFIFRLIKKNKSYET